MLQLSLIGELRVETDRGPAVLPPSRKTRALLAFLALAGRAQSRERLTQMFWDVPDDPRGALRWSLSKLRELLGDDARDRLVADRVTVSLVLEESEVDVLRLRALARRLDAATVSELEAAAVGLQGELLQGLDLPDCAGYQAWLVAERNEFAQIRRRLLSRLIESFSGSDRVRALTFAALAVQLDPDDEAAGRVLAELGSGPQSPEDRHAQADDSASRDATARLLNRPAVAVLPFENLSGDPEQEYFADGMAEDLITALCHWRWFPVIARNSSFVYKGKSVDVASIGRDLDARYLVQGSVRRAGDRIRIAVQLIDTETGHHVWADRFDGTIGDIFELQDRLTESIVTRLEPELARSEGIRAERKPPQSLGAWDLNLRALALLRRGRPRDIAEAQTLLQESLALDSASGQTQALYAFGLYQQALLVWTADPIASSGTFLAAARQAVELDSGNWLGHALLGMSVLWNRRDYDGAALATQRAVELNPSAAMAHQFYGCVLIFDGRPADAVAHLQAALRLNPRGDAATLLLADLALAHLLMRQFDESVYYARRAIAEFAGDVRAWQRLTSSLGHLGLEDEAAEALRRLSRRQRGLSLQYFEATYPFRFPDHRDLFEGGLRKAGWIPQ